ncbi:DUF6274 family protein [Streptomyces beigongshangae]|uniref:DUF6274 family protein n=1 Tax=Streptomyces beigongshangae TaxID=2841597 RepID=UPI001C843D6B|nr:DUF6274 family protein [Streptomyces sp. REN17]
MAATARHETRALLRAHLSAASGHPHRTKHCPVCHRLLRLASASEDTRGTGGTGGTEGAQGAEGVPEDGSPAPA